MIYSEQERQVYHCPFTNRAYDPLAVRRVLLVVTKHRFGALCAEDSEESRGALIAATRTALGLPPIAPDGSGVLDATVWDALCAFTGWLKGKGKRAQTMPDSAPSTDYLEKSATPTGSP